MIEEQIEIKCNGNVIAKTVMMPETEKERAKGMYKYKASPGTVMMFMNMNGLPQLYDMMWMREKLGFIALDIESRVIDVGIMKPWFTFKIIQCSTFIEGHPSIITGIKKGDQLIWQEKNATQKISTTSVKAQEGKTTSHLEMQ